MLNYSEVSRAVSAEFKFIRKDKKLIELHDIFVIEIIGERMNFISRYHASSPMDFAREEISSPVAHAYSSLLLELKKFSISLPALTRGNFR